MQNRHLWLLGAALCVAAPAAAQGLRQVPVFVNGGRLESDAYMDDRVGRTSLPMRTLFESLGARVQWDGTQRAVYAWKEDGAGVRLALGERTAQILEMSENPGPGSWGRVVSTQSLDAPATLIGQRVFVPLRFASEALHADVRFDTAAQTVHIQTQNVAGSRETKPPADRVDPERGPGRGMRGTRLAQALSARLGLRDETVGRDETEIVARLIVTNRTRRTLDIPFATGQHYEFELVRDGEAMWRWSEGRVFSQAETTVTLKANEEAVYTVRIPLRREDGRRLRAGRYTLRATLLGEFGDRTVSAERDIEIER